MREITIDELTIVDPHEQFGSTGKTAGNARIRIIWKEFSATVTAADVVNVALIVDYDLSQSVAEKRKQAAHRLMGVLEKAMGDLWTWAESDVPSPSIQIHDDP